MSTEGQIVWTLVWCLTAFALVLALVALAALVARPRLAQLRPERLARGCVAGLLMLLSLGLAAAALSLAAPMLPGA